MRDITCRPLVDDELRLVRAPAIATQLPIQFEGSDFEIAELSCECLKCSTPTSDPAMFRGTVRRVSASMIEVEAVVLCSPCRVVTPATVRIYSDRRVMTRIAGRWQAPRSVAVPWWKALLARTLGRRSGVSHRFTV